MGLFFEKIIENNFWVKSINKDKNTFVCLIFHFFPPRHSKIVAPLKLKFYIPMPWTFMHNVYTECKSKICVNWLDQT